MAELTQKSFDSPDESRTPPLTNVQVVTVAGQTMSRTTMQPGWRWSECIKPVVGTESCQHHHVGTVVSGRMHVETVDGGALDLEAGNVYEIPPGHDAWVIGDEPFVGIEVAQQAAAGFGKQ